MISPVARQLMLVKANRSERFSRKEMTMKRFWMYFLIGLGVTLMTGFAEARHRDQGMGRVGIFYSSLSPYGEWIEMDLGYVWRPRHTSHHWRPYLHGRWMWTNHGWYWVSSEPFGWATFHYGRWAYDDYYGWIWIPDDVWGPAWVEWRYDDDYIGWAPLAPEARFSFHVGITFTNGWVSPVHYWNFVPCRNFTAVRLTDYVQPLERTRRIYGNTRSVVGIRTERDRIVNNGLDVRMVERRSNSRIRQVEVVPQDHGRGDRIVRDASRERIEAYRPQLDNNSGYPRRGSRNYDRTDRTDQGSVGSNTSRGKYQYRDKSGDRGSNEDPGRRHEFRRPSVQESTPPQYRENRTRGNRSESGTQFKQDGRQKRFESGSQGYEKSSRGNQQRVERREKGNDRGERGSRGRRP